MTIPGARNLVIAYVVIATVVLTWPVAQYFNSVTPRILGLPFILFFVAVVALLGTIVLLLQERAIARAEDEAGEP